MRCAPPANKPLPAERAACCATGSSAELALLERVRVVLCLGAFAWDAALRLPPRSARRCRGRAALRPRRRGRRAGRGALLGCFHPSQQNTFTGKLTPAMIDAVLARAGELAA